nr:Unknown Function [uncultured bacterium]
MRVAATRFSALMLFAETTGNNRAHLSGAFCAPTGTGDGVLFLKTVNGNLYRLRSEEYPEIARHTQEIYKMGGFNRGKGFVQAQKYAESTAVTDDIAALAKRELRENPEAPWLTALPIGSKGRFHTIFGYPNASADGQRIAKPEAAEKARLLGLMAAACGFNLKQNKKQLPRLMNRFQPLMVDAGNTIYGAPPLRLDAHWRIYPHNLDLPPWELVDAYQKAHGPIVSTVPNGPSSAT